LSISGLAFVEKKVTFFLFFFVKATAKEKGKGKNTLKTKNTSGIANLVQ
jgi:hypothetical protein